MIDLEKTKDTEYRGATQGEWFKLTFTLQVNGKLMRSTHRIYIYTGEDMNKMHSKSDDTDCVWYEKDSRVISDYWPIYAILDLLHDIGYNLKENEHDHSYRGIMPKLHTAINEYYNIE